MKEKRNVDCRFKNIGDGDIRQLIATLYFHLESGECYPIEMKKIISVTGTAAAPTDYKFYTNEEIVSHCINILIQNTNLMET